jgi:hypothetical protein
MINKFIYPLLLTFISIKFSDTMRDVFGRSQCEVKVISFRYIIGFRVQQPPQSLITVIIAHTEVFGVWPVLDLYFTACSWFVCKHGTTGALHAGPMVPPCNQYELSWKVQIEATMTSPIFNIEAPKQQFWIETLQGFINHYQPLLVPKSPVQMGAR